MKAKYGDAGSLILVAPKETLTSDNVDHPEKFAQIKHFDPSNPDYYTLPPRERAAANVLNALQIMGPLKKGGKPVRHVAGYESWAGQYALLEKGFGKPLKFGPGVFVTMFMSFNLGYCTLVATVIRGNYYVGIAEWIVAGIGCSEYTTDLDGLKKCVGTYYKTTCCNKSDMDKC